MKRILGSLFGRKELKKFDLCKEHIKDIDLKDVNIVNRILPYATDHCESCYQQVCNACGETHVENKCHIKMGIVENLGEGVLKNFNLGELIKVDLNKLRCICGKPLGRSSAICAGCGMASCSEACHQIWESQGNCKFRENFYSVPDGFTMRSILFENIYTLQNSKIREWAKANRSSLTMISAYASGAYPYIYLQRGVRNYGIPNNELLELMQPIPRNADYYLFGERRCDCSCTNCSKSHIHSAKNCENRCFHFDLNFMKELNMISKYHKQCNCPCEMCNSGIVVNTHRFYDCMHYCERSRYNNDRNPNFH